jgi:hypothetical protein
MSTHDIHHDGKHYIMEWDGGCIFLTEACARGGEDCEETHETRDFTEIDSTRDDHAPSTLPTKTIANARDDAGLFEQIATDFDVGDTLGFNLWDGRKFTITRNQ